MKTAPLLSIGMIFKNEERCLERCLKSLEPLRKAIPCELVMADTGATDGSRKIAERYANEVFDFTWIDDFAAARNAVMDRCHGKWYLSIDCDEWLDADISELVVFLKGNKKVDFAFLMIRDYSSAELEKSELYSDYYSDFYTVRVGRMSTGMRYHGMIHETWYVQEPVEQLTHTILHHDGYFFADPQAKKRKQQRNMKLLRQKLKEDPDDLRTLLQCIESGSEDADLIQYIRTAVQLVQKESDWWQIYGPSILCHAVKEAYKREMPEFGEWLQYAEQQFSDSLIIKIDLNFIAFLAAHDKQEWEKAIHYGEDYRKGLWALRSNRLPKKILLALRVRRLRSSNAFSERSLLMGLANAYFQSGQGKKALKLITELDSGKLVPGQVRNMVVILCQLHMQTPLNTAPTLTAFYEQISQEKADKAAKQARLAAFDQIAAVSFTENHREEERTHDGYRRPAYTAFAALAEKCEAGRGAAMMMAIEPAEMQEWLLQVEDWQALPIEALEHALAAGVVFPLPEKPLPMEVLDGLAARLTHGENTARKMALALPEDTAFESPQALFWAQALAMAALRSFDWTLGKNKAPASKFYCPETPKENTAQTEKPADTPETGLTLLRRFAALEAAALPLLYTPQLLCEENAALLPPMHRWGLYCTWALNALDAGNPQEYLALLHKGLKACPGEKDMVQFLLDRFLEDARPKASPELLALAEKIRVILSAYNPDDPAVKAIRESDAYKQVAWLIEETPALPAQ